MFRIAAALPLILVGLFGSPRGQRGGMHMGGLGRLLSPRAVKELNLTEDQQDKLRDPLFLRSFDLWSKGACMLDNSTHLRIFLIIKSKCWRQV
ncbi:hypothetical protein CEE36_07745 [candidate division TA06 bacterium B3_TA06]|uniref:Uncharacterized protein n=1 Tax=candidate division TA06 bacterium B3_TA06 TaxID=2012487 RepID=A0A532V450_UNCT6|nr:MAG: hypothetical protein CEE36_07745 [candidate division TA06 bacterium B3_TA06]